MPGARASCVTPARSLPALSPCSKFIGHIDIVIAPGVDDDDDDDEGLCRHSVAAPSSSKSTGRHCHRSCGTELLAACSSETEPRAKPKGSSQLKISKYFGCTKDGLVQELFIQSRQSDIFGKIMKKTMCLVSMVIKQESKSRQRVHCS